MANSDMDQASSQSIGTHPVTRVLVILLLLVLGALYYRRLRSNQAAR
ncbi:hypothetical protein [Arthrobacter agilis]|nr:hypothetical protein [Arthrobacter agilis]